MSTPAGELHSPGEQKYEHATTEVQLNVWVTRGEYFDIFCFGFFWAFLQGPPC